MANIATITNNIISALSGTTSQVLLGDATLTDFKLDSLTDVSVPTPGDGDVLRWNGTTSLWEASDAAGVTGSGSAGQVAYFTGATTQAGSNNLFWDNTNGRLGINTNTPILPLSVVGSAIIGQSNAFNTLTVGKAASGNWGANIIIHGYNNTFKNFEIGVGSQAGNFTITPSTADGGNTYTTPVLSISRVSNISIGDTSDSGEKLQVTGTMKVTGASSFGGNMTLSLNQNAQTTFRITNTNNNASAISAFELYSDVGFGTFFKHPTARTYKFIAGNDLGIYNNSSAGDIAILNDFATGSIKFGAGGSSTAQLTLNASGNLGLAVTPSAWTTSNSTKAFQISNRGSLHSDADSLGVTLNAFYDGAWKYIQTAAASNYYQLAGQHVWRYAASGTAGNTITWTQAMTLDASGNLGIGTTSPSTFANGGITLGSTTNGKSLIITSSSAGNNGLIQFIDTSGNNAFQIVASTTNVSLFGYGARPLIFWTNGSEALRVTSLQNLVIASTSDTGEKLQVTGTAKITGATTIGGSSTNTLTLNPNTGNPNIEISGGAGSASAGGSAYYRLRDVTNSRSWLGQINASGGLDFWFQYGGTFYNRVTFDNLGAATFSSSVTAGSFIKSGGTSSQVLLADGTAYTFPLAISSPSAGQVLKYNGTSWVNDSDAGITGSGSAGQVAYFTGATTQAGNNNLFWDSANNRLGINTNTPASALQVVGTVNATNVQTSLVFSSGADLTLATQGGTSAMTIFSTTRNVLIQNAGSISDSGQRLQVIGDTLLTGSGATNASLALLVRNSSNANILAAYNDRTVFIGSASGSSHALEVNATANASRIAKFGNFEIVNNGNAGWTGVGISVAGSNRTLTFLPPASNALNASDTVKTLFSTQGIGWSRTSGNAINVQISDTQFAPTSGTATYFGLYINGGVNQTGGASGISRGLYIDYNIVAAADWRSIEWSNNTGWGLYGAGTANNYINGRLGLRSTSLSASNLRVELPITGSVISYGILNYSNVQSDVTNTARVFYSETGTQAASFTLANLHHYSALQGTFGAGSAVATQYGFTAASSLIGATNNYGFYGDIPSGTGRWNLYMNGTAANYLNGELLLGSTSNTGEKLQVTGTMKVTGASTIGGILTVSVNGSTIGTNGAGGYGLTVNSSSGGNAIKLIGRNNSPNDEAFLEFFKYDGTTRQGYVAMVANAMRFASNNTLNMTLDASGNLGLGVTPSAWGSGTRALQVSASASYIPSMSYVGGEFELAHNSYYNGTNWIYTGTGYGSTRLRLGVQGAFAFFTTGNVSGTAGGTATFTQAMTLDASGNLMVATTTASNSASGRGNITIGGSSTSILNFQIGGTLTGYFYHDNNNLNLLNSKTGGSLLFSTESAERARVTQLGNLHIGTFSSDSGEKLQVNGTAKITGALSGLSATFTSDITTNSSLYISNSTGLAISINSSTNNPYIRFMQTGVTKFYIGERTAISGDGGTGYDFYTVAGNDMRFFAGATKALTLSTSGAATFSSSVTAASGIITGNLTVDTNTLFVDATNNRVGILTTTPSYTLDVVGSARVDGTHRIINSNSLRLTKFGIDSTSFGDIAFIDSLLISSVNGSIKLGSGNPTTFTEYLGIANGGAATFSNAVTISSGLTVNSGNITLTSLSGTGNRIVIANSTGVLSTQSTDTFLTSLTGEATSSGGGATTVTLTNSAVIGKVLTGLNVSSSAITSSDSILSAFGKIQGQINGLQGGTVYKGSWNASTNTPTITSGTGTQGHYYVVTTSGTTTIDGISSWAVGDWIIYNGTVWEKIPNVDTITSVNGQTGAVTLTTSNINEGTNLYYTDARARAAISLTTTGSSGASTYSSGVLNIPTYTLAGLGGAPSTRTLTINGTTLDLSADRSWSVGTVTSIGLAVPTGFTATSAITSSGDITLGFASGYSLTTTASQTNWDTAYNRSATALAYNGSTGVVTLTKQDTTTLTATITLGPFTTSNLTEGSNLYYTDARARAAISLTTTGTSGAATYSSGVLNIPQYQSVLTNPVTGTGTAGHVAFFNGATSITGESNLFWDATNNRLGINNALPSYSLHVTGNGYFSDSVRMPNNKALTFEQTGGSILGGISMAVNNAVTLSNNSLLGVMVFDDQVMLSGKVGIGHAGNIYGGASTALSMLNTTTAPSSSFTDAFLMYSSDVVAGNAAPHFRTENGAVIKLYQETTGVGNSIFLQGGGNSVLDDSTFDGYTLRQIVKALRNQGILQ